MDAAAYEGRANGDGFIQALQKAEPWAIARAYEEHGPVVRRLMIRVVGEAATAEDIVHDVFVQLPASLARFRGEASLRTFLCTIGVRMAGKQRLKSMRVLEPLEEPPSDSMAAPDAQFERSQLAQGLSQALQELPFEQKLAFILCEVEGKNSSEAGAIVGASAGTVRARTFLAKRKLRMLLEKRGLR